MKITEHINQAKDTLFSFEIVPPVKGKGIQELFDHIDPLMEFKPPFIDVTTSREQAIYIQKEGGLEKQITRTRPGTVGICASIMNKYKIDAVPHVICGGFTKEETEYMLVDCQYLGIDNIMALRGDARREEAFFTPTKGGHTYASELVTQINNLNQGTFLYEATDDGKFSDFCVGVAGYPEKHMEAPSLKTDLQKLKHKVAMGADYVVTQMFFDNQKYFEFVEAARAMGITIPIIPGIKPIAVKRHLNILPQVFKIDLPQDLVDAVEAAKDNKAVRQVGIEWAIQQSKELKEAGVPVLHYYSMGKSDNIFNIAEALF